MEGKGMKPKRGKHCSAGWAVTSLSSHTRQDHGLGKERSDLSVSDSTEDVHFEEKGSDGVGCRRQKSLNSRSLSEGLGMKGNVRSIIPEKEAIYAKEHT